LNIHLDGVLWLTRADYWPPRPLPAEKVAPCHQFTVARAPLVQWLPFSPEGRQRVVGVAETTGNDWQIPPAPSAWVFLRCAV